MGSVLESLADLVKDANDLDLHARLNLMQHIAEIEYRASLAVSDEMLLDYLVACFAGEFIK